MLFADDNHQGAARLEMGSTFPEQTVDCFLACPDGGIEQDPIKVLSNVIEAILAKNLRFDAV